jgi:transposase
MKTIRQRAFFRQRVLKEVTKGTTLTSMARLYKLSRSSIYRWQERFDGTVESLCERSHRPYSHPNQHTLEELKLIKRVWVTTKDRVLYACTWCWRRDTHYVRKKFPFEILGIQTDNGSEFTSGAIKSR